jgi:hypothetical protein
LHGFGRSFIKSPCAVHKFFIPAGYHSLISNKQNQTNLKKEFKMKKTLIGMTLAAVLVGMFAFTGSVFAQAEVPPETPAAAGTVSDDPLYLNHDEMVAALVSLTGLSADEIEARLAAGETAYDIAISQGVAPEDFYALLPMGGFGMQAYGQGGYGRFGAENAPRFQMQENAQYFYQDGTCLTDGVPAPLNLNLQDGTTGGRGGRWNR